jgi:hypothetical protein
VTVHPFRHQKPDVNGSSRSYFYSRCFNADNKDSVMLKVPGPVAVSDESSSYGLVDCFDHEMFEGGRNAMMFVDFQPSASSAEKCWASLVLSIPDEPGSIFGRPNGGGLGEGFYTPSGLHMSLFSVPKASKKWVWTVSTPGASDSVVPASDWAGLGMFSKEWRIFRGSGWFESHLGHVFSLFRGFLASECCTYCVVKGPLRGPFSLVAVGLGGWLPRSVFGGFGACYLFMDVTGWGNMT